MSEVIARPMATVRLFADGLRPEAIAIHTEPRHGSARAEIVATTPLHERLVVLARTEAGLEIVASVLGHVPPPGTPVWLAADTARALLFDAESGDRIPARVAAREFAA